VVCGGCERAQIFCDVLQSPDAAHCGHRGWLPLLFLRAVQIDVVSTRLLAGISNIPMLTQPMYFSASKSLKAREATFFMLDQTAKKIFKRAGAIGVIEQPQGSVIASGDFYQRLLPCSDEGIKRSLIFSSMSCCPICSPRIQKRKGG